MKSLYLIKKLTLYNQIIKLKSYWFSHIAVAAFYLCEVFIGLMCFVDTDVKNFGLKFITFQIIGMLGIGLLGLMFCPWLLFMIIFNNKFYVKNKFICENTIYNILWIIGIYVVLFAILGTVFTITKNWAEDFLLIY